MSSSALWFLCALVLVCLQHCDTSRKHGGKHPSHHHHHQQPQQEQSPPQCFTKEQLSEMPDNWMQRFSGSPLKWDSYNAVTMVSHLEKIQGDMKRHRRNTGKKCPSFKFISQEDPKGHSERSLSPWRYRINEDENRYPKKLAFAECLCHGCINTRDGEESATLNSVVLEQTMMVLRRKPCPHSPATFTFEVDYIKVPVGCTCVVPRYG
ncbi:interleukin-17C [Lissotriton helveticus]